jgi:dTDP-4-dehydrorhamnose reductase
MRILVIGRHGQLATALSQQAHLANNIELVCLGRPEIDLAKPETVAAAISAASPQLVVNAAAYTAVDKAEAEAERVFAVNRDGAEAVARAAAHLSVPLVHISTDYVFSGEKAEPYAETDETGPINIYGLSKLEGEKAVMAAHPSALILRTSWVFSAFGSNFVKTMLRLGAERDVIRVVNDQLGNPTGASDLADAILRIAPSHSTDPGAGGIYHYCGAGSRSWHGFASFIFEESAKRGGPTPKVEAIATADFPTPAKRPANSRLDTSAFTRRFGFAPPSWEGAAIKMLERNEIGRNRIGIPKSAMI